MDRFTPLDELRKDWLDHYVKVDESRPELRRFAGRMGRVVTVNYNGRVIVDFQDGGWYDVPPAFLHKQDPAEGQKSYKNVNSAQVIPDKQG